MLKSFTVKNYRCFQDFTIGDLDRVNLIAGKNNTGKTALLEAIRLHVRPGDWRLASDMNRMRGFDEPFKDAEDLWGWLFHDRAGDGGLTLESRDEEGNSRLLTMLLLDPTTARARFPEADALTPAINESLRLVGASRLVLKFVQNNGRELVSVGAALRGSGDVGTVWVGSSVPWNAPCVFLGSAVATPSQDVRFFGELELAKRLDEIVPVLKDRLEPRLERLSLVPLCGEPVIHGDIGLPRLVPVPFMGEGTRRVLSILLAIANARGGVVLIDEIENGLHWSVQKQVWQAIGGAARRNDVQVFATTHSWECINAAREAFADHEPYDLALHRLDRVDGDIRAVGYDKDAMDYALEMSHEVR